MLNLYKNNSPKATSAVQIFSPIELKMLNCADTGVRLLKGY